MCRLVAIRHCSARKIDMQIYAQILVISLARPAALATTARRVCAIYCRRRRRRRHPRSFDLSLFFSRPLRNSVLSFSTSFSSRLSFSSFPSPSFSLSSCLRCSFQQQIRVLFLSACSRAPRGIAGLRRWGRARGRSDAERWVRGYKTGLARV